MSTDSTNLYSIFESAEKFLIQHSQEQVWASVTVPVATTLNDVSSEELGKDIRIIIKTNKLRQLKDLALISFYLPKEIKFLLQVELRNKCNTPERQIVKFILESKAHMELYLKQILSRKGAFELFGSELDKTRFSSLSNLVFVKIINPNNGPRIPEKRQIGVGYRDKGHLPDIALGGAIGSISLTSKMNEIEENRAATRDTLSLIRGFLE